MPRATFMEPMKALGSDEVPEGRARCEIKFDGYRALAVINGGKVELWSRNHKPLDDYPEVVAALQKLKCENAVIDGEIVALDAQGRSRFQLLQSRELVEEAARPPIVYFVFDLPHLNGRSLRDESIETRQAFLAKLVGKRKGAVRLSPWFDVEPAELMEAARVQELEGIIVKRLGSRYETGRRSGAWLKCKLNAEQEFVIGGFTPPQRSRPHFGAILVGYYRDGKLMYAGKVGTGFDHARLRSLHAELLRREAKACPFANLPMEQRPRFGRGMTRSEMREVTWVRPELVAQVKFAEWTNEGILRQPVFLGLREDKAAAGVGREAAAA